MRKNTVSLIQLLNDIVFQLTSSWHLSATVDVDLQTEYPANIVVRGGGDGLVFSYQERVVHDVLWQARGGEGELVRGVGVS